MENGTYSLEFLSSVERALAKLPRSVQQRVRQAIDALAHDPRPAGAKLLSSTGEERIWRLRVGITEFCTRSTTTDWSYSWYA